MDPDKLFDRYSRIRALSEQGVGGEKDNAQRKRLQMEQQHPWLLVHWDNVNGNTDEEEDEDDFEDDFEDESEEADYSELRTPQGEPNWQDLFSRARELYGQASGLFDNISQARLGVRLADASPVTSRQSRSGNLLVGATIPEDVLDHLGDCNLLQLRAFRQRMLEKLGAELNELLGLDR